MWSLDLNAFNLVLVCRIVDFNMPVSVMKVHATISIFAEIMFSVSDF